MSTADGLVRLAVGEARQLRLVHLMSGLDSDESALRGGARATTITGYTEWLGSDMPRITVGWDWEMIAVDGVATLRRLSLPRSNLVLDGPGAADGILGARVDAFDWQSATLHHLAVHFGK